MSLVSPSNVLHIFHLFWRALDILYRLTMLAHQFLSWLVQDLIQMAMPPHRPTPSEERSIINVLPTELLLIIMSHVPTTSLPNVVKTCRTLRPLAESFLYRHLDLHQRPYLPLRWKRLFECIIAHPHLAKHVRSFRTMIRAPWLSYPFTQRRRDMEDLYNLSIQSLILMTNLKTLEVDVRHGKAELEDYTKAIAKLQLVSLSLPRLFNPDDQAMLTTLLSSQHQLQQLSIPEDYGTGEIPHSLVRHLRSFSGNGQVARRFVPGRPFEDISVRLSSQGEGHPSLVFPALAQSTSIVRRLSITNLTMLGGVATDLMFDIAKHLPALESLRVTVYFHSDHGPFVTGFLQNLPYALAKLPILHHLDLSGIRTTGEETDILSSNRKPTPPTYLHYLETWSSYSERLSTVIFPSQCRWVRTRRSHSGVRLNGQLSEWERAPWISQECHPDFSPSRFTFKNDLQPSFQELVAQWT